MKNSKLNQWLWRWHVIAGLVSLPFVLVLSVTGGVYLFKDKVEHPVISQITDIGPQQGEYLSYDTQLAIAQKNSSHKLNSVVLPFGRSQATEFVSGKFSHKKSIFINPFTKEVAGKFKPQDTWMYTVRKLHGELLGGKVGTKIVELIASWMIVLILTGIYVFWPAKERGWKGLFSVRTQLGSRILLRDIHAVGGFWISALLLLTLAGGLPWTDVFGENYKQLQQVTHTGFPKEWFGVGVKSIPKGEMMSLDDVLSKVKKLDLPGKVTIDFPKHKAGVYSASNQALPLGEMKKVHFDAYSGKQLMVLGWGDIGVLMQARLWLMAFHQGQMGGWNFALMLFVAIALTVVSVAGLFSFRARSWGIPSAPDTFKVGYGVIALIVLLAVVFPLFGFSLLFIFLGTYLFAVLNK